MASDLCETIMVYIDERLPLMTEYEHTCVSKHDLDIRDFLAVTEPKPRISGMLDWERVRGGDALTALVGIWVWLHYLMHRMVVRCSWKCTKAHEVFSYAKADGWNSS